jgi:hypothetical protein
MNKRKKNYKSNVFIGEKDLNMAFQKEKKKIPYSYFSNSTFQRYFKDNSKDMFLLVIHTDSVSVPSAVYYSHLGGFKKILYQGPSSTTK